jgi:hypothetical protein
MTRKLVIAAIGTVIIGLSSAAHAGGSSGSSGSGGNSSSGSGGGRIVITDPVYITVKKTKSVAAPVTPGNNGTTQTCNAQHQCSLQLN